MESSCKTHSTGIGNSAVFNSGISETAVVNLFGPGASEQDDEIFG